MRDNITGAIQHYLDVIAGRGGVTLHDLAKSLDGLVTAYHESPDVEPDTSDSSAPRVQENPIIEAAAATFPDLDWYALVEPDGGPDQEVGLSIAVGDLAEIAADLHEVLWLFENATQDDAVWQFRWGYQFHWGKHLHELRAYLHSLAAW